MPYPGSPCESEEGGRRRLTHSLAQSPPGNAPAASPGGLRTSSSSSSQQGLCPAPSLEREAGAVRGMLRWSHPKHMAADGIASKNPKSRRIGAKRTPEHLGCGAKQTVGEAGGKQQASPSVPSDVFAKNPGYKEI